MKYLIKEKSNLLLNNKLFISLFLCIFVSFSAAGVALAVSDKILVNFKPNYLSKTNFIYISFTPDYNPVALYPEPVADLAAEPVDGAKIKLTWTPSISGDAAAYTIYYASSVPLMDYSNPADIVSHPEATWTSPALTAGQVYYFVVRTVNDSANEEINTDMVSATALGSLSGVVKASIKIPQNGKKISGNQLMIMAEITSGKLSDVKQVLFEYKNNNETTTWTALPAANSNHPNPDTKPPYFIQWDAHNLAAGKYNIRAVATDIYNSVDPSPGYVTVTADHNDPDVCEGKNEKGEHEKKEKVSNQKDNTIKTSDNEKNKITQIIIPKGCMSVDSTMITVVVDPVLNVPVPERFYGIDEFREITLQNGTLQGEAQLIMQYADDNDDGILDGTDIPVETLCVYSYNTTKIEWEKQNSTVNEENKTVNGKTTHFSLFALFGAPAADLSGLKIYPNPFKPSKGHTYIKFDNLTLNTKLQIFTLAGDIIFEKEDIDIGDFSWQAVNQSGKEVASGVYICLITNDLGEKKISKIAVIR
ncbi:MAG: T9SS type A sorting domain-containing protein [Elusimicrobiota bacterium]